MSSHRLIRLRNDCHNVISALNKGRIRRRLREIVRLNGARTEQGYDLILVARGRAAEADYHRLEADVLSCLERLRLMKKDVKT